ncbi:M28 family metallopeptidase [soil metagenome]
MRSLLCLLLLTLPLVADDKITDPKLIVDAKILSEIKDRSQIMANLAYLSDTIGPRLTTSPNLEKANRWAEAKMTEYGLTNVHLEPWEAPIGWTRGTATMSLTSPIAKPLTVCSAGWSPGTPGPVTGPVVLFDVKTRKDLEQYKGKLKGAILLRGKPSKVAPVTDTNYGAGRRPNAPMPKDAPKEDEPKNPKPAETPKPPSDAESKDAENLQNELKDFYKNEGVACMLRDSAKPHGLLVTTGGFKEDNDRVTAKATVPSLFMTHEDYTLLYRIITEQKKVPEVTLEVTNTFTDGPVTVYNTVGELLGSEKPDEIVVLGAHLDSWDLARGTTDNGTGSCVILETARTLAAMAKAGHRPKRTLRFVLFTGEEQGLHGSKNYVKRHDSELAKTSAALVHDTGTGKVLNLHLMGRTAIVPILEPELLSLKAIGFEGLSLTSMSGTDHLPFEKAGVPGFPCKQEWDEYRFTHHTQSDTFDKAKPENLVQGAQVLALTAYRIADLPAMLPREKPKKDEKK